MTWRKKTKTHGDRTPSFIFWRLVLVLASAAFFVAAVSMWLDARDRQLTTATTTTSVARKLYGAGAKPKAKTSPLHPGERQSRRHPARVGKPFTKNTRTVAKHEPASSRINTGLLLGLLGAAAALLLAGAFFSRLSELTVLGTTMKLLPAVSQAVEKVSERASSPEDAAQLLNSLLPRVLRRMALQGEVTPTGLQTDFNSALRENAFVVPDAEVEVSKSGGRFRVRVRPSTVENRAMLITTEEQHVLVGFPETVQDEIRRAGSDLGRAMFAISSPDGFVLAALVFDMPDEPGDGPIQVTLIAQSEQAPPGTTLPAATQALSYLAAVDAKAGTAGIVYEVGDRPRALEAQTLRELGFEPEAGPEERWRYQG